MSDLGIGLSGLGVLILLLLVRVPIAFALILVGFAGIWVLGGWPLAMGLLRSSPYYFAASWSLSAVPMFLLMGFTCYHSGLTSSLFRAFNMLLNRVPGGLAVASVFAAAGFATVSGSSVATSAAMGRIAIPEMLRAGYNPSLAAGTTSVAGTIGALIPPSILMILYGIIAEVPIPSLFLGGTVVGIITAIGYFAVIIGRVMLNPSLAPKQKLDISTGLVVREVLSTWPVFLLAGLVFGGLFSGYFSSTEAGAVGAFASIMIAIFTRSFNWSVFASSVQDTVVACVSLFIVAIGAMMLARFMALSGVTDFLSVLFTGTGNNAVTVMIIVALIYLVLGMFLDPLGAMLLTLPVLLPVISDAGINKVWFGVILVKLLEIGMITPPVGMNVFVVKGVVGDKITLSQIFYGITWFLVGDIILIGLLIAYPQIILAFSH